MIPQLFSISYVWKHALGGTGMFRRTRTEFTGSIQTHPLLAAASYQPERTRMSRGKSHLLTVAFLFKS